MRVVIMVRCPSEYDDLMRGAGAVWEPGARQWLVQRRRIGPVIRELERIVLERFAIEHTTLQVEHARQQRPVGTELPLARG